eukprot:7121650-Ditylum_brightwellii.AAC.1
MMEVQLYQISNASLYKEFGIDPLENILHGTYTRDPLGVPKQPYGICTCMRSNLLKYYHWKTGLGNWLIECRRLLKLPGNGKNSAKVRHPT